MSLIEAFEYPLLTDNRVMVEVHNAKIMNWSAITLPLGFKQVSIYVGSKRDWLAEPQLRAHELYHVGQFMRMGLVAYYWAHLVARIKTRSIYAVKEPIEAEAYAAGLAVVLPEDVIIITHTDPAMAALASADRFVGDVDQNGMVTRWYQRPDRSRYGLCYEVNKEVK